MFHRHQWTEVRRRFVPPLKRGFEVNGEGWQHQANRYLYGFTVITYRCKECSKEKSREELGDAT